MMTHDEHAPGLQEFFNILHPDTPTYLLVVGWTEGEADFLSNLSNYSVELDYAPVARDAWRVLRHHSHYDAIILAGTLSSDPYATTAALRLYSSLPIILLFTTPEMLNATHAVDAGADEWLLITVPTRELAARIHARVRRYRLAQRAGSAVEHYNGFALNPQTGEFVSAAGQRIRLTPSETHVLRMLAASPHCPVAASELAHALDALSFDHAGLTHLLSVIHQLRAKLADTPSCLLSFEDVAFQLKPN